MLYCVACGAQVSGAFCQKCGQSSVNTVNEPKETNPELVLLQRYADEIQALGEQLADADPQGSKTLQKNLDRKIEIYAKQLNVFKEKFPGTVETKIFESALYGFLAVAKFSSVGFMRRAAAKHNSLALGLVAKQQEKSNANEALNLLDKAIGIYDDGRSRFAKAGIYHSLKQDDEALSELNHVIEHSDQNAPIYLQARQLKDEIVNPPKKGMCFIATAAYGSVLAPEVVMFSRFRDNILLKSRPGVVFVRLYYVFSPGLATIIRSSNGLRLLTRVLFLRPLLYMVKQSLKIMRKHPLA